MKKILILLFFLNTFVFSETYSTGLLFDDEAYENAPRSEMERAVKKANFESAIVMIKDFQLAIDDVVKKLNIKKEELLEYINKKNPKE